MKLVDDELPIVVVGRDLIVLLKEIYEWTKCLSYKAIMFLNWN